MTVIAWDGTTLAADKQLTHANLKRTVTKVKKIRDHLVGTAGDWDGCTQLMRWFERGALPDEFPSKGREQYAGLVVITPERQILKYEQLSLPYEIEDPIFALGTGREVAMGALEMGATSVRAVQIACKYINDCGMGIDWVEFD